MTFFKQTLLNRHRAACVRATAAALAATAGAVLLATAPLRSTAAQPDERDAVALDEQPPAMVVRYGDLNLATDSGARVLLARIHFAADAVCPAADKRDLERLAARNRCVRLATARAVQQVGNARVAAVSSGRSQHG